MGMIRSHFSYKIHRIEKKLIFEVWFLSKQYFKRMIKLKILIDSVRWMALSALKKCHVTKSTLSTSSDLFNELSSFCRCWLTSQFSFFHFWIVTSMFLLHNFYKTRTVPYCQSKKKNVEWPHSHFFLYVQDHPGRKHVEFNNAV